MSRGHRKTYEIKRNTMIKKFCRLITSGHPGDKQIAKELLEANADLKKEVLELYYWCGYLNAYGDREFRELDIDTNAIWEFVSNIHSQEIAIENIKRILDVK